MTGRQSYCCGFLFTVDKKLVLLLKKTKPDWQKDLWNGMGGHVEKGETPLGAMQREAQEEAQVTSADMGSWHEFAEEYGRDYRVHFFAGFLNQELGKSGAWDAPVANDRGERFGWHTSRVSLHSIHMVGNLTWLVPLALDWRAPYATVMSVQNDISSRPWWSC